MGPCQMFASVQTPPVLSVWADWDHCPFFRPNPQAVPLCPVRREQCSCRELPRVGYLRDPPFPSWRGRMTSWHTQPMGTAYLMHLPPHPPAPPNPQHAPSLSHHSGHSACAYPLCRAAGLHILVLSEKLGTVQSSAEDKGCTTASSAPAPAIPRACRPGPIWVLTPEEHLRDINPSLLTLTEEPEKSVQVLRHGWKQWH